MDDDELANALFRSLTGEKWETWTQTLPTPDNVTSDVIRELLSNYPLIHVGFTSEYATFNIAEEERTHTHILGLPGEGKSKFLELFCRHDIDRLASEENAPGFCLIDSGDFGNTFNKVLRYCRYKGFKKVAIIDPNDIYGEVGRVATINIFGHRKDLDGRKVYITPKASVVAQVRNTMRILWEGDALIERRINKFLRALTEVLYESGGTLADLSYFSTKAHESYKDRRSVILAHCRPNDHSRVTLEDIFYHQPPHVFMQEFGSTIRVLDPLFEHPLPVMIGSTASPMNFTSLMAKGYAIICNLDPKRMDVQQRRFLGTLIINEVIQAQYALVHAGRNVPFYLYIDEVGRYATEALAEVIDYKRTSNLKLVMAHQRYSQIKNPNVMDGLTSARFKVLFYAERADRERMIKQMYYGDAEKHASDVFHDLEKQHAVIKVGKAPPRKIRLADVPDIPEDDKADLEFKKQLCSEPWYRTRQEVYTEIDARFKSAEPSLRRGGSSRQSDTSRAANSDTRPVGAAGERKAKGKNHRGSKAGAVPDNRAGSEPVLLSKKRRTTRKIDEV